MPDFAVESLQLQRGVGTSTNGAGAGASLNMLTDNYAAQSTGEISNSLEASILESTVKFSTGLMNDHFEIADVYRRSNQTDLLIAVLLI
jgi:iron complex outermembrane receptor protein